MGQGELTDHYVGRTYGYAVLGSFYGRKDWASGVFGGDMQLHTEEEAPACAATVEGSEGAPVGEAGEEERADAVESMEGAGTTPAASSSEGASRQTSLAHWLL